MGMTGPGETHKVEIEIEGPKDAGDTQKMMHAIRELLKKYGAKVGRQEVLVTKKSRPPDPS